VLLIHGNANHNLTSAVSCIAAAADCDNDDDILMMMMMMMMVAWS